MNEPHVAVASLMQVVTFWKLQDILLPGTSHWGAQVAYVAVELPPVPPEPSCQQNVRVETQLASEWWAGVSSKADLDGQTPALLTSGRHDSSQSEASIATTDYVSSDQGFSVDTQSGLVLANPSANLNLSDRPRR